MGTGFGVSNRFFWVGWRVSWGGLMSQRFDELAVPNKYFLQTRVFVNHRSCFGSFCCKGFNHAVLWRVGGVVVV